MQELDIVDQLGHVRTLIAFARISPSTGFGLGSHVPSQG